MPLSLTFRATASRVGPPHQPAPGSPPGLVLAWMRGRLHFDADQRPIVSRASWDLGRRAPPRTGTGRRSRTASSWRRTQLLRDDLATTSSYPMARPGLGILGDPVGRQDVRPARHHLADLHVGRPNSSIVSDPLRPGGLIEHVLVAEHDAREPTTDGPDGRIGQGDIQARAVDRVVDLLEAEVLNRVPSRRGQGFEESPDASGPVSPEVPAVGRARRP